jgi:hypothetical protein
MVRNRRLCGSVRAAMTYHTDTSIAVMKSAVDLQQSGIQV